MLTALSESGMLEPCNSSANAQQFQRLGQSYVAQGTHSSRGRNDTMVVATCSE